MPKSIIITESQLNELVAALSTQYPIEPEKVLIVKKFLDKNFQKSTENRMGSNGLPTIVRCVKMVSPDGTVVKECMYKEEVQDLLDDQFKGMYSNDDRRMKFLGQVMKDWYENKIGLYGSLSVNHL